MDSSLVYEKWLKRAKSNLIRAKLAKGEEVFYEDLCFDSQQAAEKALKALLVYSQINFRFVHDIGELIHSLEGGGIKVPSQIKDAAILTNYAVETRYPSPAEPVSKEEYEEAVRLAELVFNWVTQRIIEEDQPSI